MRLENFYRISPTTSTALLPICVHSWDDFRLDGITVIEPYKNDEEKPFLSCTRKQGADDDLSGPSAGASLPLAPQARHRGDEAARLASTLRRPRSV